jgi:adenine-specific DNA-methyltransferase
MYRYEDYFQNSAEALKLFLTIPFLNGGLFECLDKPNKDDPTKIIRIDGFSDHHDNEIRVPDFLFFSNERDVDLNKTYDTKNKSYKVRGLIDILERYKFTINENTPIEEEVALDPELLGKVFENLLASYNPETQTTARKATGSHYTPRVIVNHMVDESLIAYLTTSLKEKLPALAKTDGLEDILREVFAYREYKGNEHY